MLKKIILGAAVTTTALTAGVFLTFAVAINPAFRKLSDKEYILKMQKINRKIQNPFFFSAFFGAAVTLPLAIIFHRKSMPKNPLRWLTAAAALYTVGTFGTTIAANVPLNEKLDKFHVQTTLPAQAARVRQNYARSWNGWNTVRTIASLAAIVSASIAVAKSKSRNQK